MSKSSSLSLRPQTRRGQSEKGKKLGLATVLGVGGVIGEKEKQRFQEPICDDLEKQRFQEPICDDLCNACGVTRRGMTMYPACAAEVSDAGLWSETASR